MNGSLRRAMDVASVVFAVLAIALAAWPIATTMDEGTRSVMGSPGESAAARRVLGAQAGRIDSVASGIVRGNVFSASRRAPSVRFVAPGSELAMSGVPGGYSTVSSSAAAGSDRGSDGNSPLPDSDAAPALYGIVSVDGTRRALLVLRTGDAPRLFRVDERHAGFQIRAIEVDRVVVQSPRGLRTLRMAPAASRDSSGKTP